MVIVLCTEGLSWVNIPFIIISDQLTLRNFHGDLIVLQGKGSTIDTIVRIFSIFCQAREAVEMRAQLEKKLAQKEKEKKEQKLVELAQKAREERAGIRTAAGTCRL